MNILQISFHTSPFGSVGKFDSGGLNVYVQQISKQLSNENKITVVTGEKAENFFEITTNILANSWESEEGKQGIKAFFEKKPAPWVKKGESNGQ